jgi:hypothetical protein
MVLVPSFEGVTDKVLTATTGLAVGIMPRFEKTGD